jgi:hypothetical protein
VVSHWLKEEVNGGRCSKVVVAIQSANILRKKSRRSSSGFLNMFPLIFSNVTKREIP